MFGGFPKSSRPDAKTFAAVNKDGVQTRPVKFEPEKELPLSFLVRSKIGVKGPAPACLLLHLDGKAEALNHPLAAALVEKGCTIVAPDLRATGEAKPEGDVVHGAPIITPPNTPSGWADRCWVSGLSTFIACSIGWRCNRN